MVTARLLAEGSLTNATIPALSVATSQVEIITNVEEARIGEMKTGQQATIVVPAYPGVTFPAKVASIAPTADTRTHTFPIKVRPDPVDPRLLAGMFAEVKIITREKDNVVLVPKDGVVQRTGRAQVYLSVDGRARVVDVSAGLSDDRNVEAPSGVKAGDLVIVQGQATVNDGDAVRAAAPSGARPPAGAPGKPEGTPAAAKPEGAAPAKADGADTPVAKPDGGTAAKPAGTTGAKPEGTAAAATPTR
jgi:RND family efflux transporter MFP subunit